MKVIAFNGSPRPKGNTWQALCMVTAELEAAGIGTEIVSVGNRPVRGCLACGACFKAKNEQCIQNGDEVNQWIQLAKEADGILLGSPTHYAALGGTFKCFLDRLFYVAGANGGLLRHKVGAAAAGCRSSPSSTSTSSTRRCSSPARTTGTSSMARCRARWNRTSKDNRPCACSAGIWRGSCA